MKKPDFTQLHRRATEGITAGKCRQHVMVTCLHCLFRRTTDLLRSATRDAEKHFWQVGHDDCGSRVLDVCRLVKDRHSSLCVSLESRDVVDSGIGLWSSRAHLEFESQGVDYRCVVISQTHRLVSQERLFPGAGTSVSIDLIPITPSGEWWFQHLRLVYHTTLLPPPGGAGV